MILAYNDVTGAAMIPFFVKNHIIQRGRDFKSFANGPEEVLAFAEHARTMLQRNCPSALCSPVLRVDIFETLCNSLCVNEFENLDALCDAVRQPVVTNINGKRIRNSAEIIDNDLIQFRLEKYKYKTLYL